MGIQHPGFRLDESGVPSSRCAPRSLSPPPTRARPADRRTPGVVSVLAVSFRQDRDDRRVGVAAAISLMAQARSSPRLRVAAVTPTSCEPPPTSRPVAACTPALPGQPDEHARRAAGGVRVHLALELARNPARAALVGLGGIAERVTGRGAIRAARDRASGSEAATTTRPPWDLVGCLTARGGLGRAPTLALRAVLVKAPGIYVRTTSMDLAHTARVVNRTRA